jgi:hypothetical protein
MSHQAAIVVAVVLTAAAVTFNALVMGPAVTLLNAGLMASLSAWLMTGAGRPYPHRLVRPLFLASIAIQTFHFVKEYAGEVHELVPPLFSFSPLPAEKFVVINLIWIGIFLVSAVGVFRGVRLALLPVWFMALIGGIGNSIFHTWLAVQGGGYAPGLATALINLPLGVALVVMLVRVNPMSVFRILNEMGRPISAIIFSRRYERVRGSE